MWASGSFSSQTLHMLLCTNHLWLLLDSGPTKTKINPFFPQEVDATAGQRACVCSRCTLYPMRGTGVQEITIEVSVTPVLKWGALPMGGSAKIHSTVVRSAKFHVMSTTLFLMQHLNSLVVNWAVSPSLSMLSCSACSVAEYTVSGFRLSRVYWVRREGSRSCVGVEPSTVRKSR